MVEASLPEWSRFLDVLSLQKNKSTRIFLELCLACMYSYSFIE